MELGSEAQVVRVDFLDRFQAEFDVCEKHLTEQRVLYQLLLDAAIAGLDESQGCKLVDVFNILLGSVDFLDKILEGRGAAHIDTRVFGLEPFQSRHFFHEHVYSQLSGLLLNHDCISDGVGLKLVHFSLYTKLKVG